MKKKQVFVDGYFEKNLGDDLFLLILLNRYRNNDFVAWIPEEYEKFIKINEIKNLTIQYSRFRLLERIFNKIFCKLNIQYKSFIALKYNVNVIISGSIYMENKWNSKINPGNQYGKFHKNYKKIKRYLLGNNFGPYQTEQYKNKYVNYFNECEDICFRDYYSYNLFAGNCKNVRYAPDIILGLNKNIFNYENIIKQKYIVISVINTKKRKDLSDYTEIYSNMLIEIANYYTEQDYKVIFMSFCDKEGDREFIDNLYEKNSLNRKNYIEVFSYDFDIKKSLSIINFAECVIATRFHAMILGWVFNIPTVPIVYSNKMQNVIDDFKFEGIYYDIKNLKSFEIKKFANLSRNTINNIDFYKKESNNHFNMLDKILFNNSKKY